MENKQTWKQRLSGFLIKNAPPGMNTDRQVGGYITGLVTMLLFSFSFLGKYYEAYNGLFIWTAENEKIVRANAVMPDFSELLGDSLNSFFWYCVMMLLVVAWNYLYYYQGSKSIYLMKRLPNRLELHWRAWVLPLLAVIVTLLTAFVVLVIYFEIYMIVTPKQCIVPGQWQNIWR